MKLKSGGILVHQRNTSTYFCVNLMAKQTNLFVLEEDLSSSFIKCLHFLISMNRVMHKP